MGWDCVTSRFTADWTYISASAVPQHGDSLAVTAIVGSANAKATSGKTDYNRSFCELAS